MIYKTLPLSGKHCDASVKIEIEDDGVGNENNKIVRRADSSLSMITQRMNPLSKSTYYLRPWQEYSD